MGTDKIMYCIVALILGMLMYHMLKGVCGCKTVEGQPNQKSDSMPNCFPGACTTCQQVDDCLNMNLTTPVIPGTKQKRIFNPSQPCHEFWMEDLHESHNYSCKQPDKGKKCVRGYKCLG